MRNVVYVLARDLNVSQCCGRKRVEVGQVTVGHKIWDRICFSFTFSDVLADDHSWRNSTASSLSLTMEDEPQHQLCCAGLRSERV
jgi:hypothetical protein